MDIYGPIDESAAKSIILPQILALVRMTYPYAVLNEDRHSELFQFYNVGLLRRILYREPWNVVCFAWINFVPGDEQELPLSKVHLVVHDERLRDSGMVEQLSHLFDLGQRDRDGEELLKVDFCADSYAVAV